MAFQLRFVPDEPIVMIEHRGDRSYSLSRRAKVSLREGLRSYLEQAEGITWIIVDFSQAGWSFADQTAAAENLTSHFDDMGGLDFLTTRIRFFLVGENEVTQSMARAMTGEYLRSLPLERFADGTSALAAARAQIATAPPPGDLPAS